MQLDYRGERIYGCEGEKSDSCPSVVVSAVNEDAEALHPGQLACFGSSFRQCRLPNAQDDVAKLALGIVLDEHGGNNLKPGKTASILRQGRVFVCLETPVKQPGEQAYVALNGFLGGKSSEKDKLLNGAVFCSSGNKGDVIELELNLMGGAR